MDSLAVVSGGMDSITLLYDHQTEIQHVVSFDYGSKHNAKEIPFAARAAEELKKPHTIIALPFIAEHFKSNLLQSGDEIPDGHYADPVMKKTVVPFRNGIMLSIAAGFAESLGLQGILLANHFGDHAIYPDCRADFIAPMVNAIEAGTYSKIVLGAPYTGLTKRQIALIGKEIGVDYSKTWSCYKGGEIHCGVCGTCVERKEALDGFDITVYQI